MKTNYLVKKNYVNFSSKINVLAKSLFLSFLFVLISNNILAQCPFPAGATQVGTTQEFCVNALPQSQSISGVQGSNYVLINVVKGFTYTFSVGDAFVADSENLNIYDSSNTNISNASGANGVSISNWIAPSSGQIKLMLSYASCNSSSVANNTISLNLISVGNTLDSQTAKGTNTWVGHVYNWASATLPPGGTSPVTPDTSFPFNTPNYIGYYTIGAETFNEDFGGNSVCLPVLSGGSALASVYTETFAVRYRMNSTRPAGCYLVTFTGDDGVRLYIDGVKYFDQWQEQSPTTYGNILVYLNGNSDIIADFYENGGQNIANFSITPFDPITNEIFLDSGDLNVCNNVQPGNLDGTYYSYLNGGTVNPSISFQWQKTGNNNSTWTDIVGATGISYSPIATTTAGTVQYRRIFFSTYNATGCKFYSNSIAIKTDPATAPATPVSDLGTNQNCNSFNANWHISNIGQATVVGFLLYVSSNNSFNIAGMVPGYNGLNVGLATSTGLTSYTYTVTGLNPNTQYFYRLRAVFPCTTSNSSGTAIYGTYYVPKPTIPTLSGPPCGFTVNWVPTNSYSGLTNNEVSYLLDVSTVNTFATFLPGFNSKDMGSATSQFVDNSAAIYPLYVRIRSVDACGLTSVVSSYATQNAPPPIAGTMSVSVGETTTLVGAGTPNAITPWTSSAPDVATISNTGVVTGIKFGTTTITYMNSDGCIVTALFTVNVVEVWKSGVRQAGYSCLKKAFDAINNGTHINSGGLLEVKIISNTFETVSAILNASGTGSANYGSVRIYPTKTGLSVTGMAAANANTLILFEDADNVTLDGSLNGVGNAKDLQLINSTRNGIIYFRNGASNITVQYCTLKDSNSSNEGYGIIHFNNSVSGKITTNNTITDCDITNAGGATRVNFGVYSQGGSGSITNIKIQNCNFFDLVSPTKSLYYIYTTTASSGFTIQNNSFYETNPITVMTNGLNYNLINLVSSTTPSNFTFQGNKIGGSAPNCGGSPLTFASFDNTIASTFTPITVSGTTNNIVQNNQISNISLTGKSNSVNYFKGIYINGGTTTVDSNTIGADTGTNSIVTTSTDGTLNPDFYGIYVGGTATSNATITNNKIGAITTAVSGSTTYYSGFTGIYLNNTGTNNVSNNLIGSLSTPNSIQNSVTTFTSVLSPFKGIYVNTNCTNTIINNTLNNITNNDNGKSKMNGIFLNNGANTVSNNTITNFTSASTLIVSGTSNISLTGIQDQSANTTVASTISGNIITRLYNTHTSNDAVSVVGIFYNRSFSAGVSTINANFVSDLKATGAGSTDTTSSSVGIEGASSGGYNSYNNIIDLGTNITNGHIIYGILDFGSGVNTFNFNTVYLQGVPTNGLSTIGGTYAFYSTNTSARNIKNNLFYNARSNGVGGANKHYAISIANSGTKTIDYNDYYASGTGAILGYFGGDKTTFAVWKTATTQDSNSLNLNPCLSSNYDPATTLIATPIASPSITTDYNGTIRDLTFPQVGAIESYELGKSSDQVICANSQPTDITLTGSVGTIIKWQKSATLTFATSTDIANTTTTVTGASIGNLTATTYFRAVGNTSCSTPTYSKVVIITVNALPTTPVVGVINQPTCTIATGSVVLSSLPSGTWTINPGAITGTGTSKTISGLTGGTYNYTVTNALGCVSAASANVVITPVLTNTWNGTTWSLTGTTPPNNSNQNIVFAGDYNTMAMPIPADLTACSCQVTSGTVTISAGDSAALPTPIPPSTLTVINGITVSGGALIFEDKSSLVQINDAAVNSGDITYMRVTTPVIETDYTYWSSPVEGFQLGNVSVGSSVNKLYSYNSNIDDWKSESTLKLMDKGIGYITRSPKPFPNPFGAYAANFVGKPNNGSVTVTVSKGNTSYLVGNPYPSAIDADQFILDNSNAIDGTLYFWTHNTEIQARANLGTTAGSGAYAYTTNDYATYTLTGGTGTRGSLDLVTSNSNGNIPSGYIAACEGFFVTSILNPSSNILFNNSMRVSGSGVLGKNSQFYKTKSPIAKISALEKNRIWLDLTNDKGAFKETLVGYITGATNDLDKLYDGISYDANPYIDFYSVLDTNNLTVQGRALPFDSNEVVPLGYHTTIEGSFTINLRKVDGFFINQDILLEDKQTNTITNLRNGDYTFTTALGTFNNRFQLRYGSTLGTKDLSAKSNEVLVSCKNKQIRIDSYTETIKEVNVYDLLGRLLCSKTKLNCQEFILPNLAIANQTVIVKTQLNNENTVSTKLLYQ